MEVDKANVLKNLDQLNNVSFKEFAEYYSNDLQRFIFINIHVNSKSRLWRERINHYLQISRESSEVVTKLNELLTFIKPELFTKAGDISGVEKWVAANQKIFGKDKLSYILSVMRMAPSELGNLPMPSPGNGSPSSTTLRCNCSQSSDWCSGSSSYCKTWQCSIVTNACGTFWVYDCDGRCYTPNN